jgi:aspartate ammonia-lyase
MSEEYRIESDLLGEMKVPADAYYGVQTQRAINNYKISTTHMYDYPDYVIAIASIKLAAAETNKELGALDPKIADAIIAACREIIGGKFLDQFPVDMMQGGAGTSVNMNANEVIANRALELMGHKKGEYQFCSPNDHVNCAQSTNDAYPSAFRYAFIRMNHKLVKALQDLIDAFAAKGEEFKDIIKMGRTQLQDAVPMTSGQEFHAFATNLGEEILNLDRNVKLLHEINMGGTAIGTGLNAKPGFAELCAKKLTELTGEEFIASPDLVEATPDTGAYVSYSGALKRLAVKLSKICNDLRLLTSGPRCGLKEINLPPMAPGSSIMPGKVNPVIPEVTNQVCFKVIGNDTTVAFAAEAGQLQLNVMEPVIAQSIMESITWLTNAMNTLREKCVNGITVNKERCYEMVKNSIGIVTALNPLIGYKNSTKVAKEALETNRSVYDIVLEKGLLTKDQLDKALDPKNMIR